MGFFVFIGIVVGSLAGFLILRTLTSKRGPEIPLVRIGMTSGENEAQLWQQALAGAGIWSRLMGGTSGAYPSIGYQQELWVKESDAELARDVLGISCRERRALVALTLRIELFCQNTLHEPKARHALGNRAPVNRNQP